MGNKIFDYPKSVYAVMDAITITANRNSTLLDFFVILKFSKSTINSINYKLSA
jgi:hypothetical protein